MWKHKRMTRRAFIGRLIKMGMIASVISSPLYAHFIERKWLNVHRVKFRYRDLPSSFHGMTIAVFSDTHIGFYFGEDELESVVSSIQREQPDCICFIGDLINHGVDALDQCVPILRKLTAPFGKFAVLGNHDFSPNPQSVVKLLGEAGFTVLQNESVAIQGESDESILIAGLRDAFYDEPDLSEALAQQKEGQFTIVLAHEPDIADETAAYPVHLQLSGHTHGGQIRLPVLGHLVAPPYGKKYVDRINRVPNHTLDVYTTRGVGTTGIPVRFFCRPEIAIIRLEREEE